MQHFISPSIYFATESLNSNPMDFSWINLNLWFYFFPFFADDHEVDVIGYGAGGGSDDDHSSIRSGASSEGGSSCGGGLTKWTRHLTLGEGETV